VGEGVSASQILVFGLGDVRYVVDYFSPDWNYEAYYAIDIKMAVLSRNRKGMISRLQRRRQISNQFLLVVKSG